VSLRRPLAAWPRTRARSPLRRRIDDTERMIMLGLLAGFLIAAPLLAILTGRLADAAGLRQQYSERAWRDVPAVLQQSAAQGVSGQGIAWGGAWVKASWQAPDGARKTGYIAVGQDARAGQRVHIWVTGKGQVTHPPLRRTDVLDGIANAVLGTVVGLAVLIGLAAAAVRIAVNGRRMSGWGRAWAAIGPRWTSLR
jgi:hypothetical protein